MSLATAYLALGSNVGDRLGQLRSALGRLEARGGILVVQASRVYENRAVGMGDAAAFLNAVVEIKTTHEPEALLDHCLAVEVELGRVRTGSWAPRTIDIDLLAYGDVEMATGRLQLPHPRIAERDFVVQPLMDLDGGLRFGGESVRAMAETLRTSALRALEAPLWPDVAVNAIVACGANRVIGKDGRLPWSIPEDWEVFLKKTKGGTLLMGRTSFFEMLKEPTWADDREYVVITRQPEKVAGHGVAVADSVEGGIQRARERGRPLWICGGARVYSAALPWTERLHLTEIDAAIGGDTFFPEWRQRFKTVVASVGSADANYRYMIKVYKP